jgi:hypothetical protein
LVLVTGGLSRPTAERFVDRALTEASGPPAAPSRVKEALNDPQRRCGTAPLESSPRPGDGEPHSVSSHFFILATGR